MIYPTKTATPSQQIKPNRIPSKLKERDQWMLWKYELRDGKRTKVPYQTNGQHAKSNDPATWATFDKVLAAHQSGQFNGIAYVFSADDPFCGIDLDACVDPGTRKLTKWAEDIVTSVDSYTEFSPSGTGVKIVCRAALTDEHRHVIKLTEVESYGDKSPEVAIYDRGRYWCLTGHRLPDLPRTCEERQAEINAIYSRYFPARATSALNSTSQPDKPGKRPRGRLYQRLLNECQSASNGQRSERDFELCATAVRRRWDRESIWSDAQHIGKFGEKGREYFDRTWSQAEADVARYLPDGQVVKLSGNLAQDTAAAWDALIVHNRVPRLFRYGGMPTRIETDEDGQVVLRAVDANRMRHELARAAAWLGADGQNVYPGAAVVTDVLATPDMPLPHVTRIVPSPIFAACGDLVTEPGYHASSRTYFAPSDDFEMPELAESPTEGDVAHATTGIVDHLLVDFPFVSESERATAVALLLLPFAREFINGPTPLHLIEKPTPGTGATLLVDALTHPFSGGPLATMTAAGDEAEWRKLLTAKLLTGPAFAVIDNVRGRLDSAALSSAITAIRWEDRLLGTSRVVDLPVRCAWVATANNASVSDEIARRCVRCRLDAKVDRPWLREKFKHPDLRGWIKTRRVNIVRACLTIIRAWHQSGRPLGQQKLGMFESWSEVMGGILAHVGIGGFLENLNDFYAEADSEGEAWRDFVHRWFKRYAHDNVKASELFSLAEAAGITLGGTDDKARRTRFGKQLGRMRDRTFTLGDGGSVVIRSAGKFRNAQTWKLAC